MEDQLLTKAEVAEFLGIGVWTVQQMMAGGKIRSVRLNEGSGRGTRFRVSDMQKLFGTTRPLLKFGEAAKRLSIAVVTLKKYLREGKIKCVRPNSFRTVRFSEENLSEYIEGLVTI